MLRLFEQKGGFAHNSPRARVELVESGNQGKVRARTGYCQVGLLEEKRDREVEEVKRSRWSKEGAIGLMRGEQDLKMEVGI